MQRGKRADIKPADETTSTARLGTDERQAQAAINGGRFCRRCDAWLGVLGLEPTPDLYVEHMVSIFAEVRRVLRSDGTLWINIGDSYAARASGRDGRGRDNHDRPLDHRQPLAGPRHMARPAGLKNKDLVGVPWLLAFALRADGWWLRAENIWGKGRDGQAGTPDSTKDRTTRSHEQVFQFAKAERYFYDDVAIRDEDLGGDHPRNVLRQPEPSGGLLPPHKGLRAAAGRSGAGRNKRSVWNISTEPYPDAHFAVMPKRLAEPCILAGTSPKACGECGAPWRRLVNRKAMQKEASDRQGELRSASVGTGRRTAVSGNMASPPTVETIGWEPTCDHDDDTGRCVVLDPFSGAGTVGLVSLRHNRSYVGIELNPEYAQMARDRIRDDAPLLNVEAEAA